MADTGTCRGREGVGVMMRWREMGRRKERDGWRGGVREGDGGRGDDEVERDGEEEWVERWREEEVKD